MFTYRGIEIVDGSYPVNFRIGPTQYGADNLAEARALIDGVLDVESVEHRGILATPFRDDGETDPLAIQLDGRLFLVNAATDEDRKMAARILIDGLLAMRTVAAAEGNE